MGGERRGACARPPDLILFPRCLATLWCDLVVASWLLPRTIGTVDLARFPTHLHRQSARRAQLYRDRCHHEQRRRRRRCRDCTEWHSGSATLPAAHACFWAKPGLWRLRFRRCGRVSILGASVVTVGCVCAVTAAFANTPGAIARSAAASRECTQIVDAKDIRRFSSHASVKAPVVSSDTVVLASVDPTYFIAAAETPRGVLSTAWVLDGSKLFSASSDEDSDYTVADVAYAIYLNIEHHRA